MIYCVQCQEEVKKVGSVIKNVPIPLFVCDKPKCPNYLLVQLGVEGVDNEK